MKCGVAILQRYRYTIMSAYKLKLRCSYILYDCKIDINTALVLKMQYIISYCSTVLYEDK